MDDNRFNEIRQAISDLKALGGVQQLEAVCAPNVFEALKEKLTKDKQAGDLFTSIPLYIVPEMPDDEMAIVPAGTNHQIVAAIMKARREREKQEAEDKEKGQFTIQDQRQADWLNYLDRKGYIKVVEKKQENGREVKVVGLTEEGKRAHDTQKFQDDKIWFFETGQLPKE